MAPVNQTRDFSVDLDGKYILEASHHSIGLGIECPTFQNSAPNMAIVISAMNVTLYGHVHATYLQSVVPHAERTNYKLIFHAVKAKISAAQQTFQTKKSRQLQFRYSRQVNMNQSAGIKA